MEHKVISRNIISSILLQLVTIISGFVIPKVILSYFGSNVNGLISSINQFLNYIQLLEGGLSGVIMSALYRPLAEGDDAAISRVMKAAQQFFQKIAFIFVAYMLGMAFVYPLFVKTGFSYIYSLMLVIVLGSHLFVQYFFALSWKLLLNADRKVYIVSVTQIVIVILNIIAVIVCSRLFKDVLIIKIASAAIYVIQPVIYGTYVKKHYKIDPAAEPDNRALSQRWSGFGINLAYFVHTNTDVAILTLFSTLVNVSVYSVYLMVVNAMKNLVISVSSAIMPSFGKVIVSESRENANRKFELYEFGIYFITTIIFTCGLFLITPFIRVYTSNIHDANYEQYLFGYLLTLAEMAYCYRDSYVTASSAAGHFKQVTKYAVIEVVINLALSLTLVHKLGIVGVAIGTLVSMIYRGIAHVIYLRENILYRNPAIALKKMLVFGGSVVLIMALSGLLLNDHAAGYLQWFILAVEEMILCSAVTCAASFVFFRNDFMDLLRNTILRKMRK